MMDTQDSEERKRIRAERREAAARERAQRLPKREGHQWRAFELGCGARERTRERRQGILTFMEDFR